MSAKHHQTPAKINEIDKIKVFTRAEFVAWVQQQKGKYSGSNGRCCAMTQFGKAMLGEKEVCQSYMVDLKSGQTAILVEPKKRKIIARIDLTPAETRLVVNMKSFEKLSEALK